MSELELVERRVALQRLHAGAVYLHGKPRIGNNEVFKEKVNTLLLEERVRWNDELKKFTAKVCTPEQVIMIREAMKMVSEKDEEDLNESAPTDEDIADVFDFAEVKSTTINIIECIDVNGEEKKAIAGATYQFKTKITNAGFNFDRTINMWLAPVGTDTAELEEMMDKYGFTVDTYDEAMEDDE